MKLLQILLSVLTLIKPRKYSDDSITIKKKRVSHLKQHNFQSQLAKTNEHRDGEYQCWLVRLSKQNDTKGHCIVVSAHSALCSSLIILVLSLGLLLELDDWHSVQVAVCPTVIYAVLQQVLCRKWRKSAEERKMQTEFTAVNYFWMDSFKNRFCKISQPICGFTSYN